MIALARIGRIVLLSLAGVGWQLLCLEISLFQPTAIADRLLASISFSVLAGAVSLIGTSESPSPSGLLARLPAIAIQVMARVERPLAPLEQTQSRRKFERFALRLASV